jgi:hypothetical protein
MFIKSDEDMNLMNGIETFGVNNWELIFDNFITNKNLSLLEMELRACMLFGKFFKNLIKLNLEFYLILKNRNK